ncbi:MAG: hypothetical protein V8R80_03690 [Eubacterium sp.]
MFQHKLGYALAVRTVRREITRAFPQWLMQLGLLLQSENVQVSIARSEPLAPQILRPAIRKMVQEMEYEPESEEPFLHFLDHFRAEGVTPAMRMLYSVSAGCSGEPFGRSGILWNGYRMNMTSLSGRKRNIVMRECIFYF